MRKLGTGVIISEVDQEFFPIFPGLNAGARLLLGDLCVLMQVVRALWELSAG